MTFFQLEMFPHSISFVFVFIYGFNSKGVSESLVLECQNQDQVQHLDNADGFVNYIQQWDNSYLVNGCSEAALCKIPPIGNIYYLYIGLLACLLLFFISLHHVQCARIKMIWIIVLNTLKIPTSNYVERKQIIT
jgi:hypothetical protein